MSSTTSTTGNSPDAIRRDIESTRRELSDDVDALTDRVSPKRVMERRVDRTRGAFHRTKEKIMGSSPRHGTPGTGERLSSAASSAGSSVTDVASSAPDQVRGRTEGNPLAAGLIAFGAGWLVSSLLPATEKEKEAASALKDRAQEHSDTLTAPLKEAASDAKDNLREPAKEAAESVKSRAQGAAENVKGGAGSAAGDVRRQAQESNDTVQDPYGGPPVDVRDDGVGSHRAT